ncbi:IS3 family transposase [Cellulophaga sp. E16_2]|uniref:IS3 family transposase n=1 Tax=Cellulophaga sp. E16_2 TaxID=2789297 RepID=UPI0021034943|nr:IS3 family transposase [Cellulophaga sp. E16_2]
MYRNDNVIRRYSEPLKLKISAKLTIGKHTKSELCKRYSIPPTTVKVETKDEFYLDQTFDNVSHAKRAAKNTINLYNEIRLHLSLDYKTLNMVYQLSA